MTMSEDIDRIRVKQGIHAVLDAILDAKDTLPSYGFTPSSRTPRHP